MRNKQQNIYPCVCFMLIKEGEILLERRALDKATEPGVLSIPGGHVEAGETCEAALVRELLEELDIGNSEYQFLCSLYHPCGELQLLHYYVVTQWQGEIKALEAEQVHWYPLREAPVDIAADKVAIQEYLRVFDHISKEVK